VSTAPEVSETSTAALTDGQVLNVVGQTLNVRVSPRRTRLALTVERDGTVTLHAPRDCTAERAEDFAHQHRRWMEGKLALRERLRPVHPTRRLVDGEIFRYLGRSYRLQVRQTPGEPVRLVSGRLCLDTSTAADPRRGRREIIGWYRRVGRDWALRRLQPWVARLDVAAPRMEVRDLRLRWGSYTPGGETPGLMALNWALFQLPAHLVDYVIAHELAHITVAGHGREYWRLLRRALPECEERRNELDELGRRVWLGDVDQP
jgi:predicted metal-dependent hydrolase